MKLTPEYSHKAMERMYKDRVTKYTKAMVKSLKYWLIAELRKQKVVDALKVFDDDKEKDESEYTHEDYIEALAKWGVNGNGKTLPQLRKLYMETKLKNADPSEPKQMDLERLNDVFLKLGEQWDTADNSLLGSLNATLVKKSEKYINEKFKKDLNINMAKIDGSAVNNNIKEMIYAQNADLITSIPQEILERFKQSIYNNVATGNLQALENEFKTIAGISERRAKTLARDQTAKMLEAINITNQKNLGIEYYMWRTAGDERVSTGYGGHKQLEGKIYRYDSPEAIIDSYGNKGHPAQRVNCRCIARGIILDLDEKIERADDGEGYKVVKK